MRLLRVITFVINLGTNEKEEKTKFLSSLINMIQYQITQFVQIMETLYFDYFKFKGRFYEDSKNWIQASDAHSAKPK